MSKGPDAFRTISEAADELDVPQHVLRFWETRFSFIRPMKRAGGRRFYRPQDIAVLRGVKTLLHEDGYTIKGVQKILREQGVEHVKIAVDAHAAAKRAREGAKADVARPAKEPAGAAIVLDAHQVKALQGVLSELKACQALLADGSRKSAPL